MTPPLCAVATEAAQLKATMVVEDVLAVRLKASCAGVVDSKRRLNYD